MPGPALTEAQKTAILTRRQALTEIQGIAGAMQDLLSQVEATARDDAGDQSNPWLIGDSDLSVAIGQWNGYKTSIAAKIASLP